MKYRINLNISHMSTNFFSEFEALKTGNFAFSYF